MFDPIVLFLGVVVVAIVLFAVSRQGKHDPLEVDEELDPIVVGPAPVVTVQFDPSTLKFGESYTASWNSEGVEALHLSWTGPDGGYQGMSLSVPSGSVTNPTGPVGTYSFTLTGTDANANVVATARATLVVEPAAIAPLETVLEADAVELDPIVIGPTPVKVEEELAPIVIGPTPAVKKAKAVKKPAKKAAPKKPAKKAAPKKR